MFVQISFDFEGIHELASDKLVENWPVYACKLKGVLQHFGADSSFATIWPKDIEEFLMLLKLLPEAPKGRKTLSNRENFNGAIEKLIVYQPVRLNRIDSHHSYLILLNFFIPRNG